MASRGYSKAKEKIIEAASELFFSQGYQTTTIDQVIEHSGVSRPTVYSHFSTKEEMCLAYLKKKKNEDLNKLKEFIRSRTSDKERFLGVIHFVREALIQTKFRGCGYFNMISEFPDPEHPIAREAKVYVDGFREVIEDVVKNVKSSNVKYKNWDTEYITGIYYVLVCGAIMASQEYREPWHLDQTIKAVENLMST